MLTFSVLTSSLVSKPDCESNEQDHGHNEHAKPEILSRRVPRYEVDQSSDEEEEGEAVYSFTGRSWKRNEVVAREGVCMAPRTHRCPCVDFLLTSHATKRVRHVQAPLHKSLIYSQWCHADDLDTLSARTETCRSGACKSLRARLYSLMPPIM
jgi:hypothetical protein